MSSPRSIPDPGFPGDDGAVAPEVAEALATYRRDPAAHHHRTLATVQDSRVLVPVVAVLGEVEHDEHGLAHDKTSDMAAVLMKGRDGRSALPDGELERRLLELGFVEGARVELLHEGLFGKDPIAVRLDDMRVALRRREAAHIFVQRLGGRS